MTATSSEKHAFGDAFVVSSGREMTKGSILGKLAKRYSSCHYFHLIETHVKPGSNGLEFGCGGGNYWLARNYNMTGLEYGLTAAEAAAKVYKECLHGDVSQMAFHNNCFDFTCSCFVLEHLPEATAIKALEEACRVLRPGGVFIALMDLHCDRPFMRRLRNKYPKAYTEAMIDVPGHRGLITAGKWKESVLAVGFEVLEWRLLSRFPVSDLATYAYLASAPSAPPRLRALGNLALWIARQPYCGSIFPMTLTFLDDIFGWIFPKSWAYRLLFVLRKSSIN